MIMQMLSKLLRKVADDIDGGSCNLSEAEAMQVFEQVKDMQGRNTLLSKYEACKYLQVSRATFDRWVADGKIPQGKKRAGWRELSWSKADLNSVK